LIAAYLENTSLAAAIRDATWAYPILEIIHITGIALLVGAAFMFDLRLLGASRHLPVMGLARHLLPWSRRGLLLIIPSGFLLFITNAVALANNPVFWLKMGLLAAAGINALVFRQRSLRIADQPQAEQAGPPGGRINALLSLLFWIAVITCGRLLAY
jgi:hypothetical protein